MPAGIRPRSNAGYIPKRRYETTSGKRWFSSWLSVREGQALALRAEDGFLSRGRALALRVAAVF